MKSGDSKKISPNIIFLGIASLLNDLSSEMILPILPMLLNSLGGNGIVIGIAGALKDSISSLLKVLFGYWSDKTGKRKTFVYAGYLTSTIFKVFLAFSKTWQQIVIFIGLERTGKGMRTAAIEAIISESMPKQKGTGFGIHRAFDTTGAILGSIVAFALFWFLHFDFQTIILAAAIIAFAALLPLRFVKEEKKAPQKTSLGISLKKLPKKMKLFMIVAGLFALGNVSYMFFILKSQKYFSGELAIGMPILLYILFNLFYALFAIPFGRLSDKTGRRKIIVSGFFLFAIVCFGFALADSIISFTILFALYGLVFAMVEGNQRAFVSDMAEQETRGTALGTFHTITGLMALPAGIIAGTLWMMEPNATFFFGSATSIASILLFLALNRK